MTVYTGQVSHKNGLGRVRNVTATDDMAFALAFGVSGSLGAMYSNQKIGMLQLEGEASHNEVAIDPSEMTRIEDLDYAKGHVNAVQDFGALANALAMSNRSELMSITRKILPTADYRSLSDTARGEVVKVLLGVGDAKTARLALAQDTPTDALIDTIRRSAVRAHYNQNGEIGGVEFTVRAQGTTAVQLHPEKRLVNVRLKMAGYVAGSISSAGSKFKQSFADIKREVSAVSAIDDLDKNIMYDPDENVEATASNVYAMLLQTTRQTVRREVTRIESKFADLPNFNPASAKARLWGELNLTVSEVPQTKLNEGALEQYSNNEITAMQFAMMPENNMADKLTKAVVKRLENADMDSFMERISDILEPDLQGVSRKDIEKATSKSLEKVVDGLIDEVEDVYDFAKAYELYGQPNSAWERKIMSSVEDDVKAELSDTHSDKTAELKNLVGHFIKNVIAEKVTDSFTQFRRDFELVPFSNPDQPDVPQKVIDEQSASLSDSIFNEVEDINFENADSKVRAYINSLGSEYFYNCIRSDFDFELAITNCRKSLLTTLADAPYSEMPTAYWQAKIVKIPAQLKTINHFANPDNLKEFIETYAPDWLSDLQDIQYPDSKEQVVTILSNTEPFSKVDRAKWETYVSSIDDRSKVIDFAKKPTDLTAFVDENIPDWKEDIEDMDKDSDRDKNSELDVRGKFKTALAEEIEPAYEEFKRQYNIKTGSSYDQAKVVEEIVDEQTDLGIDDFLDYDNDENADDPLSENNVDERIKDYVEENYDSDFLITNIERKYNFDSARTDAIEEARLYLVNTEPYGNIPDSYWVAILNHVSLNELLKYINSEDWNGFVEANAPDWQEQLDKDPDED